ncbi:MAG: hypothetical protein ACE5G0_13175 [Rhodothermales bacterium]
MKKLIAFSTLLLMLLSAGLQDAQAQRMTIDLAPFVGYGLDVPNQVADRGSVSVGALAHIRIKALKRVSLVLNPDVDYYLTDTDATAFQLDGNLLLQLGRGHSVLNPYAGLGIALTSVSGNDTRAALSSGTNIGLNVIVGTTFGASTPRVFFQGRATFGEHNLYIDDDEAPGSGFGVQGGIIFRLQ